jgi:hypothetical protein
MAGKQVIRDIDRGYRKLMTQALEMAKGMSVTVGIHEAEGQKSHGELAVIDVGTINEFGGPNNNPPRRSFIRDWADENRTAHEENLRKIAVAVLYGKTPSMKIAFDRFGLRCVGEVQKRISDGIDPPQAESTIARKGSSTPLIDTGLLRASIAHKVNEGGAGSGGGGAPAGEGEGHGESSE